MKPVITTDVVPQEISVKERLQTMLNADLLIKLYYDNNISRNCFK